MCQVQLKDPEMWRVRLTSPVGAPGRIDCLPTGRPGVAGGVPIKYRGEVIGGVGSSGAVGGDKDELCSQAGIDAVADQLR